MHDGLSERFHEKHRQLRDAQRELRALRSENAKLAFVSRTAFWRLAAGVFVLGLVLGLCAAAISSQLEAVRDACMYHAVDETTDPEPVAIAPRDAAMLVVQSAGYDTPGEVF